MIQSFLDGPLMLCVNGSDLVGHKSYGLKLHQVFMDLPGCWIGLFEQKTFMRFKLFSGAYKGPWAILG